MRPFLPSTLRRLGRRVPSKKDTAMTTRGARRRKNNGKAVTTKMTMMLYGRRFNLHLISESEEEPALKAYLQRIRASVKKLLH